MTAGLLDCITTPAQGNILPAGVRYCADNGKFGAGWPGEDAWWTWLQTTVQTYSPALCAFAVAPDVPFDALATLDLSLPWLARIRELGIPAALVAQNGFEHIGLVPWDEFDVLFLGGTMECLPCGYQRPVEDKKTTRCPHCGRRLPEWKVSAGAWRVTSVAKARGKYVHCGRVNSRKRLQMAEFMGCDSADGTYISKGPDINLSKALSWHHGQATFPPAAVCDSLNEKVT